MTFEPETWTAEQYLGRAEAGRTKPLRLKCSRKTGEAETARDRAEFYAKFVGLSEAIDFGDCFSFLYPILGMSAHPWEVSRQGIAERHVFHRELKECAMDWPMLTRRMLDASIELLEASGRWLPVAWSGWADRVYEHFKVLQEHDQELLFEVVRSVA